MKIKTSSWFVLFGLVLGVGFPLSTQAQGAYPLETVQNNLCDTASLQRGARLYVNYCGGCHSLEFIRFDTMAKDIGMVNKDGKVLTKIVEKNLNFVSDKITDPYKIALPKQEAIKWFGVAPPDLSLITRSRGKNWVYTYLRTFYEDPKRPWGVNNLVFPDVGMPHMLQGLQGTQEATYKTITLMDDTGQPYQKEVVDSLVLKTPGSLNSEEFDQAVTDLVNFLEYVGEPHKLERERLGVWVLLFLVVFALFAFLLKREYWKDIH